MEVDDGGVLVEVDVCLCKGWKWVRNRGSAYVPYMKPSAGTGASKIADTEGSTQPKSNIPSFLQQAKMSKQLLILRSVC